MSSWRDQILKEFTPKVARLTLVADPDGLLLEEGILHGIRERGFELIPFEDHVMTDVHDTPPLSRIYFYLTEGCNLACRHCWLAPGFDPDGSRHAVLPVELFETAIREARPLGLARVKLTGGEPLLHPPAGDRASREPRPDS